MNKFENIKVGDKVAIRTISMSRVALEEIIEVTKVTKTQFTLKNGNRYFKETGYKFGEATKYKGTFSIADRII